MEIDPVNRDFRDLFAEFNAHGVEYLVVGAHALAVHGHVRATKDLDVWVRPDKNNATRVFQALSAFGAPLHELSETDLAEPGLTFQIGIPPIRIDVMTAIDGVDFEEAWSNRMQTQFLDQTVSVLSKTNLIQNKRASRRTQDLADLEWLEAQDTEVD